MDTLSLRLFLRVADIGTMSGAARDLSLSPASASARLARLEKLVGFRLFNRTTRAVSLTTDGAEFLPYARQALEMLDTGLAAVSGHGRAAQGLLRMTLPGSFGRMHVIPYLSRFRERHPLISLDLRLSDEVLDVVEGAYDLVIRNAPLADSRLVARRLAPDRRLVVASPAYLERHGTPTSPGDLAGHACVVLADYKRWKFEGGQAVAVSDPVVVNDGEAMRDLIEGGLGIGVVSTWIAGEQLKSGQLVEVLREFRLVTESSIWALYPKSHIVAPKVRAMIDFLLELYRPVAPWDR